MIKFDGISFYKDENGDYTNYQACIVGFRPESYPLVTVEVKKLKLGRFEEGQYPLSELLRGWYDKNPDFTEKYPIILPMNYLHPNFKDDLDNLTKFIAENYCFRSC